MNCTGVATTFVYEGRWGLLLTEAKDDLTAADEDRLTRYEYGPGATISPQFGGYGTQQTKKTVWPNLAGTGNPSEITDYTYSLQGRMSTVTIDADGDGTPETQLKYEYNDHGIRTSQTETTDTDEDGELGDETPQRTDYLVDEHNPTGYAQVLEEWLNGTLAKTYTIGHDVFAEAAVAGAVRRLLKDGHGSTRMLVDAAGLPLSGQIYRFDAYGNAIGFDPALALTTLLYNSEQFDWRTGLTYLRARYYDLTTGRFNRLDPFGGHLHDPLTLHKYLFVHGDPINGIDPRGLWTITGMVTGLTIGMTVTSMTLPVLGAAYLSVMGKISPVRLVAHLGEKSTWAMAAASLMGGAVTSAAMQKVITKVGRELAGKAVPWAGLFFSAYGLYESIKMTYKMITEELPAQEAERYLATMLLSSILAVAVGSKLRRMAQKGGENDAAYWAYDADDQAFYDRGQKLLPNKVWQKLKQLGLAGQEPQDVVARGRYLTKEYGAARSAIQTAQGLADSLFNYATGSGMTFGGWLNTGLTPSFRSVYGEHGATVAASIAATFGGLMGWFCD